MPFWLSHHHADELDRTVSLGGVRVCARCLATYPTLAVAIAVQFKLKAPLAWERDVAVGVALLLPALFDWAYGRLRPRAGTNALRMATGLLLGLALGRSLYIHLQRPLPPVLLWQLGLALLVAGPVLLWTYGRKTNDIDRSS